MYIGQVTWPLLVQTTSQPDAELCLPAGVQLMLIGVKLSTMLVAVAINNGKFAVVLQGVHIGGGGSSPKGTFGFREKICIMD